MRTLDHSRLGIAAQALGIAQGATDYAVAYAHERIAFGKPILELQGIEFKLADMETRCAAARELLYRAAAKAERHERDLGKYSAMAKLFCSDVAMEVTVEAVQVLGGYGYVTEYPVERMMRDAKLTQIYEGTNEIQRVVIARALRATMNPQNASAAPTTHEEWQAAYGLSPERDASFTTLSGEPVKALYTEADLPDPDAIGLPGVYPFTRGVYPSMYRGRLWTVRQFAGFGTAEETNERFHYLLDRGQQGLSTAFDMPSLMGHDSDHPLSLGEVGREGVAVDTLDDMQTLFAGIDVGEVSVSMTINAPAAIMLAFYVVAAERQGIAPERLSGTIQADILKEYIAQKEWCFPIDPAMRLLGDMIEWCTTDMPRWHPVSISGYHIREAGSTAAQELAFTLKDGLTYVEQAIERGLDVDDFAPRLSFFFNAQIDFFEEIAKYRAARRIWARELRETFGARNPKSWLMRFHTQTAGVSLTAQQPLNNITRTAIEALAGRARRHAVAAHELLRRGARAADRGGRPDRAAHAAGHRARDRRDEHDRPARRLVLRRGADRPPRGARLRLLPPDRPARRDGRGGQAELPAARDRGRELLAADRDRRGRARRRRRQPLPEPRRRGDPDPAHRPGARAQAARPPAGRARPARRRRRRGHPRRPASRRGAAGREPHAGAAASAPAPTRARARSSPRCRTCGARTSRRRSTEVPRRGTHASCASSSPSPGSTATTAARRSSRAHCATPGWRSSTPACTRRPSRSSRPAIQEDADAIGLSILSGAHMTLVPRIVALLREQGVDDVLVTVGGTIPGRDIPELKRLGVAGVFTPGTPLQDIIDFLLRNAGERTPA